MGESTPEPTETVTLDDTGAGVTLPVTDAEALVAGGKAKRGAPPPPAPPIAVVLTAPAGPYAAGRVLIMAAALAASLGPGARPATQAEQEIAWPKVETVTSL